MSAWAAFVDTGAQAGDSAWLRGALARFGTSVVQRDVPPFSCAIAPGPVCWRPELVDDGAGVTLAGMVRLDRREALAATLGASCPPAASRGDAALLLAAYRRWGEALLDHVSGDFSFALWDAARHRLIAATDQFGVRPLFHAQSGGRLMLSDALDAVRALPGIDAAIDEAQLADTICIGFGLDPAATIDRAIRRLPPGHMLVWRGGGETRIARYWQVPPRAPTAFASRAGEQVEAFRAEFLRAVGDRLPAEGPVGVMMSGGLDSTSVAAAAQALIGPGRITAYTGVMRGMPEEEGRFARLVTDRLGIRACTLIVEDWSHRDVEQPQLLPEPGIVPDFAAGFEAAREVSEGGGLLFGGIGGDVLLSPLDAGMFGIAAAEGWRAPATMLRHLLQFGRLPMAGTQMAIRERLSGRPERRPPPWIDPDLARRTRVAERLADYGANSRGRFRAGLTDPFWTRALTLGSSSALSLPMESSHPFFDVGLAAMAARLPEAMLRDKRVLREAMAPYLPPAVARRPKTPLGAAGIVERSHAAVQARHRRLIADDALLAPWFDLAVLRRAIDDPDPLGATALQIAEAVGLWLRGRAGAAGRTLLTPGTA